MRLVCPNCDAEYEVDASAIPDTGRDVQCSNCGHAWFQMSPRVEEELAAEEALFDPPPPLPQDSDEDETPPAASPAADLPPRTLDESLLAVLREEAERETNARRSEAPPVIETQDELGLTEQGVTSGSAQAEPDPVSERIARMKGLASPPPKPQSRREMLPEIDEINTTLRASSERRSGEAGAVTDSLPAAKGAASFRSGFLLMILLALAIIALYMMAPKLAEQIPAAKGALQTFVALVDAARLWLDGLLDKATGWIGGKAS
ncbi:hypothetical protein G4Z14_06280 [Rhodobacteraceae bacterium KMS-5]|uniref:Zinc finger/thioredoxin putative domain-containing protein n=2 Tax=Tabrizicola oligotrophica TaxID=2710650 RepID=A0A6M0QTC5_9RHOB|nr:hypothetical protein [Tabrizicola oligotrophica]